MNIAAKSKSEELKINADKSISNYELISSFFTYPENELILQKTETACHWFVKNFPDSGDGVIPFLKFLEDAQLEDMQEMFLRSFDVQAITTLDIGFILFGEDYKRGQLLVHLNKEHRDAGNPCNSELSDHLPNVLRLLPKMKDHSIRDEIALRLIIPAVEKMISEFDSRKIEKKDEIYKKNLKTIIDYSQKFRTVYQSLLQALLIALKKDFGYKPEHSLNTPSGIEEIDIKSNCDSCSSMGAVTGDYTRNIETEMNIEKFK
ncbi:MAG: hypothetical protein IT267_04800 [Saprospiraceae bacterium]|nr:hypothetical protein [Saprospiraceae bacterium]